MSINIVTNYATTAALERARSNTALVAALGLLSEETTMDTNMFEELEGQIVDVTQFQGFPLRCKIIAQDENFIKVEKVDRKTNHTIVILNKRLIASITLVK